MSECAYPCRGEERTQEAVNRIHRERGLNIHGHPRKKTPVFVFAPPKKNENALDGITLVANMG